MECLSIYYVPDSFLSFNSPNHWKNGCFYPQVIAEKAEALRVPMTDLRSQGWKWQNPGRSGSKSDWKLEQYRAIL